MKKIIPIIILILLIGTSGFGQSQLTPEEKITLLRKKISDIESSCTPKEGTSKEEVERIFGEGKPAPDTISKLPTTTTPDSSNLSYELYKGGVLLVRYKDDKVYLAGYLDPYAAKGRPAGVEVPVEEQLQEVKHRLQQMEVIHSVYLKRLKEINQKQPLEFSIKSDKQVYDAGEPIKLIAEMKNISTSEVCINTLANDLRYIITLTQEGKEFISEGPIVAESGQAMDRDIVCIKPSKSYKLERFSGVMNREVLINVNNPIKKGVMDIKVEFILQGTTIRPVWQGKLASDAVTIEVKEDESKGAPSDKYCKRNEDCKWVRDYCNCQDRCVNKYVELENCPPDNKKCKFGGFDTLICYCVNNKCVEGPKE